MALSAARRWSVGKTTTIGLLDKKAERQVGSPFFPPQKSRIEFSFHKGIRESLELAAAILSAIA
jgi:hypothetical protein